MLLVLIVRIFGPVSSKVLFERRRGHAAAGHHRSCCSVNLLQRRHCHHRGLSIAPRDRRRHLSWNFESFFLEKSAFRPVLNSLPVADPSFPQFGSTYVLLGQGSQLRSTATNSQNSSQFVSRWSSRTRNQEPITNYFWFLTSPSQ